MEFTRFVRGLEEVAKRPLPGQDAQYELVPPSRERTNLLSVNRLNPQHAAVLVLAYPIGSRPHLVLIERPAYPGVHGGQIAFPGGKAEPEDASPWHTALREAEEEVGVIRESVVPVTRLTEVYIPPSNFLVRPQLGWTERRPDFRLQASEVAGILEMPVEHLLLPDSQTVAPVPVRGELWEVPGITFGSHHIWGATAMMLGELRALIRGIHGELH